MTHVSEFLKCYKESRYKVREENAFDPHGWIQTWHNHEEELLELGEKYLK